METVAVVSLSKIGTPGSYYLLVPLKLKEKLCINESTEFVVMTEDNKIIYQRKTEPIKEAT